ncbi:DNA repair protein [Lonepinella sp. BR2930]|uniref:DNA repair protein n=1 Tax=Lonepinella sp. BR2930 TaxID=3434554 RepID=UPI003F6E36EF
MTAALVKKEFDFLPELEKTVVNSLVTSFGLDFLLFQDKKGGDVDTIHNARAWANGDKEIGMSDEFKQAYENRGEYDSHAYHQHKDYIATGKKDKQARQSGELHDISRDTTVKVNEKTNVDHTISASEIHHDAGRILAGKDGITLANKESNLNSIHETINKMKSDMTVDDFLTKVPQILDKKKQRIAQLEKQIDSMSSNTPQERHRKQQKLDEIRKCKDQIEVLEDIDEDAFRKADEIARENYDAEINTYYKSSKFLKNTAKAAGLAGLKMGARQALGLILAEVWFELRTRVQAYFKQEHKNFKLDDFLSKMAETVKNIFDRVKERFKEILITFKDSAIGGALSSITTTILNIFLTSQKLVIKLIREMWQTLVQVVKLIIFNPNNLALGDLTREIIRLIGAGISIFLGSILNQQLAQYMAFPFGTEIAAFISALFSGLLTVGMMYFLDHSAIMQKVWDFLNNLFAKNKYSFMVEHMTEINAELDRYLTELAKLEFNLNSDELQAFTDSLLVTNDEFERALLLDKEIKKRDIDLPFELTNKDSIDNWLASL